MSDSAAEADRQASADDGDPASEPTFTMECACGRRHSFDGDTDQLECDCGAMYALTITTLQDGDER